MCPLCIATGSLLLAGAGSAGGLTAVTAKVLRTRRANRKRLPAAGSLAVTASAAKAAELLAKAPRIEQRWICWR